MSSLTIEARWLEFWRRYHAGEWEPETRELLRDTLGPGDLFLDVGAWIGPVTLWALRQGATVIAIEPDPIALPELKRMVGHCETVEVWEGALTVDGGGAVLEARREFGDSMARIGVDGVQVEAWTLDEILGGRRPKLAVVDVEGYELELLPHIAPRLAELGCTVQVALHDGVPEPAVFADFTDVDIPRSARTRGRSNHLIARP